MGQKYKIFFRRHLLIFGEATATEGKADIVISDIKKSVIKTLFTHLRKLKKPKVVFFTDKGAYKEFLSYFKIIEAGGGGVFNPTGDLLLIHRLGKWDLPKGKLEKKESPVAGALREVEEECNVKKLKILEELSVTYHIYFQKKWMIKKTYWYAMLSESYKKAKPQLEEDIDEVKWVNVREMDIEKLDTYTSIREVLYQLQQYSVNNVDIPLRVK